MTSLGNVSRIVDCEHKTAPIDPNGDHFAVGTPAMRGNRIALSQARRISRATFETWTRRMVPEAGDILFAREAPVGPVVRVPAVGNVAPGQRTVLIRPDAASVDSRFLYYRLVSPTVQAVAQALAAGSTVPHLNVADVRSLDLGTLPSLDEQHAIAKVLGALDDKIAANRHSIDAAHDLIETRTRSVMQRSTSFTTLGALLRLNYGKPLPAGQRMDGDVAVVGSGGVVGSHNVPLISGPSVVVGRKGSVGEIYWLDGPSFPIDTTYWVEPTGAPLSFLYYLLRSIDFGSMSSDSAVPGLNRDRAYGVQVPAVNPEALTRFERETAPLMALLAATKRESDRLAATRDELLPLLMSGRITVKDAELRIEEES